MQALIARVLVVLKAAPAYLVALSTVITIVAEEVDIPEVARYAAIAVGVIGAAVAIIRRVTPVVEEQRGLLPKPVHPEGL